MATFNVFVEGAIDDSPTALPELAEAMSRRYGLAATDLVARLQRGRFRVKHGVDAATAERLRRDLEAIGARVIVEDSALSPTVTPPAGTRLPSQPSRATPPTGLAAAGPHYSRPSTPVSRPSTPLPLPAQPRAATQPPVSGLAAAYSQEVPAAQDLGALGAGDGALSLASLDGEDAPSSSGSFDVPEPPVDPQPQPQPPRPSTAPEATVSFKPQAKPTVKRTTAPRKAVDLFAPPDAADQELKVDLAAEELEDRARKQASAPPETVGAASQPLAASRKTPVSMSVVEATVSSSSRSVRARFAGAILVALGLGFVPVHFIGKLREDSAYGAIDAKVAAAHASVESMDTYLALDAARSKLLEEKQSKRQMIALTQIALWAAISAGLALVLLRAQGQKEKEKEKEKDREKTTQTA